MSNRDPDETYHPIQGESPLAFITFALILPITVVVSTVFVVQASGTTQFWQTLTVAIVAVIFAAAMLLMTLSQRIHYKRKLRNGDPLIQRALSGESKPRPKL